MRWLLVIFIAVMCWGGFVQHTHNKESIKKTTKELLEKNGYGSVRIDGINLPIFYTFLAKKVNSEVFITKNGDHKSIFVTVTPIESFPIVSIFSQPSYQIFIDPLNSNNLKEFLRL